MLSLDRESNYVWFLVNWIKDFLKYSDQKHNRQIYTTSFVWSHSVLVIAKSVYVKQDIGLPIYKFITIISISVFESMKYKSKFSNQTECPTIWHVYENVDNKRKCKFMKQKKSNFNKQTIRFKYNQWSLESFIHWFYKQFLQTILQQLIHSIFHAKISFENLNRIILHRINISYLTSL